MEVRGAKEALKELRKLEPELRKQFTKDAKRIAGPIVDEAKGKYPSAWLSGMAQGWKAKSGRTLFPYDKSKAVRGVTIRTSTSRRKNQVVAIVQKDPAASIVDMAGKRGGSGPRGKAFVDNLTARFGQPSRVMWPAAEGKLEQVQAEMRDALEQVAQRTNRELKVRH
jgi:mRNA-degrading endonuclease RelE of RelBE toxin-antitoxin system